MKSTAQFQVLGQKGAIHELTPSDWQVGKTGTERERMMLELQSPSYETLTGGGGEERKKTLLILITCLTINLERPSHKKYTKKATPTFFTSFHAWCHHL